MLHAISLTWRTVSISYGDEIQSNWMGEYLTATWSSHGACPCFFHLGLSRICMWLCSTILFNAHICTTCGLLFLHLMPLDAELYIFKDLRECTTPTGRASTQGGGQIGGAPGAQNQQTAPSSCAEDVWQKNCKIRKSEALLHLLPVASGTPWVCNIPTARDRFLHPLLHISTAREAQGAL